MEPLRLYLYDDGLVRIATEKYAETEDKISDSCVHICNYAINCKNTENFKHNDNPFECHGNKVRYLIYLNQKINLESHFSNKITWAKGSFVSSSNFCFQWRLRCLWKYLAENCFISYDQIEILWEEMKDIVIKTLLISHKGKICDSKYPYFIKDF